MEACLQDLGAKPVEHILARRLSRMGDAEKRPELLGQAFQAGEKLAAILLGSGGERR